MSTPTQKHLANGVVRLATADQLHRAYPLMSQLRPELDRSRYLELLTTMMRDEGYRLAGVETDQQLVAVAGYRFMTMLYAGRILVIDDLVVDAECRSRGHGERLIRWLEEEARAGGCAQIQLISRVTREAAHRFYFRNGFGIECFHFRRMVGGV